MALKEIVGEPMALQPAEEAALSSAIQEAKACNGIRNNPELMKLLSDANLNSKDIPGVGRITIQTRVGQTKVNTQTIIEYLIEHGVSPEIAHAAVAAGKSTLPPRDILYFENLE